MHVAEKNLAAPKLKIPGTDRPAMGINLLQIVRIERHLTPKFIHRSTDNKMKGYGMDDRFGSRKVLHQ